MLQKRLWIGIIALAALVAVLFVAVSQVDQPMACVAHSASRDLLQASDQSDLRSRDPIIEDAVFFDGEACDWSVDFSSDGCRDASAAAFREVNYRTRSVIRPTCSVMAVGSGSGKHMLCEFEGVGEVGYSAPVCQTWLSFGISDDHTFDTHLRALCPGCTGHLFDPSVVYPSRIQDGVYFYKLGLASRQPNVGRSSSEDGHKKDWVLASLPTFFRIFVGDVSSKAAALAVLKLDCEGCEYAIANAVATEYPRLFAHVDQVTMEVHVSRKWMHDTDDMFRLGMLFHMMMREGLQLQHATTDACGAQDEAAGCLPEFVASGMTCVRHAMCHNYLFARPRSQK